MRAAPADAIVTRLVEANPTQRRRHLDEKRASLAVVLLQSSSFLVILEGLFRLCTS